MVTVCVARDARGAHDARDARGAHDASRRSIRKERAEKRSGATVEACIVRPAAAARRSMTA